MKMEKKCCSLFTIPRRWNENIANILDISSHNRTYTGYYGFVFDFLSALMALPSHHVQPDFSRVLVALLVIGVVIAF